MADSPSEARHATTKDSCWRGPDALAEDVDGVLTCIQTLVQAESLFNDATSLVPFRLAVSVAIASGTVPWQHAAGESALLAGGWVGAHCSPAENRPASASKASDRRTPVPRWPRISSVGLSGRRQPETESADDRVGVAAQRVGDDGAALVQQ
ncbi:hypothetical protein ACWEWX_34495 [Streptomyces asiaticus]|uniref:hypothetical protein n=1 Tax=Streptomyces asiaticus TaxID=114695 RepID=UPI003D73D69A